VDAERILRALAENGTVQMPLQETFGRFVLPSCLADPLREAGLKLPAQEKETGCGQPGNLSCSAIKMG
jgi:hypothetical protein